MAPGLNFGAAAVILPSFVLMLSVLPVFERVRTLLWKKAAMKGIGPAVIGTFGASLVQLVPQAVPDGPAVAMLALAVAAQMVWRIGVVKLLAAGAMAGILASLL